MAGLAAILKAIAVANWRDLRSLQSAATNNFFLFCFLLLHESGAFPRVILGLVLLFPLTADPLRKVPEGRLDLWPVSRGQRLALRVASVWLSPAAWITVGLLLWAARPTMGLRFLLLALAIHALGLAFTMLPAYAPRANPMRYIPAFPGRLGGLIRKNLREMLSVLDIYAALVLSASGVVYRVASRAPEPDAFFGLSLMTVLALSTYAQCLFGLDSDAGFARYRLLPLRGWRILAAKDIAYLLLLGLLVLPLAPLAGLAAGLVALAAGHHAAVRTRVPQTRWRFTGAPKFGLSLIQVVLMFGAGTAAYRKSALVLAPCAGFYALSLWFYGRELEGYDKE